MNGVKACAGRYLDWVADEVGTYVVVGSLCFSSDGTVKCRVYDGTDIGPGGTDVIGVDVVTWNCLELFNYLTAYADACVERAGCDRTSVFSRYAIDLARQSLFGTGVPTAPVAVDVVKDIVECLPLEADGSTGWKASESFKLWKATGALCRSIGREVDLSL